VIEEVETGSSCPKGTYLVRMLTKGVELRYVVEVLVLVVDAIGDDEFVVAR
jgi:hypothetical protein